MLNIKTKHGLRRAVEREYGRPLKDETWAMLEPDYGPTYNEYDVHDVLKGIRDFKPKELKKKNVVKAIRTSVTKTSRPSHEALKHRSMMRYYREHILGLKQPVSIDKIRTTIEELSEPKEKGKLGYQIAYPQRVYSIDVGDGYLIDVYEIDWVYASEKWLDKTRLQEVLYTNSNTFGFHPAIILAFIMCDRVPKVYSVPMIIRDGLDINIVIHNPEIPLHVVSKAYTAIREGMIREKRPVSGKRARPRGQTERVNRLLNFIRSNITKGHEIDWQTLFEKWNTEHPEWAYGSIHSMRVVWYRARDTYWNQIERYKMR